MQMGGSSHTLSCGGAMRFSAGIDLGGTYTKLALVDSEGRILVHRTIPSQTKAAPEDVLAAIRKQIESMCAEAQLPYPPSGGCGIGMPGVVDYSAGVVKLSGPFGWKQFPARQAAMTIFGCSAAVDTDVNAGVLADLYFGCARESSETFYVSWGTGIGTALTVGRNVYHSRNGATGNLSHTVAVEGSRRRCFCGLHGCLEAEIGARALVNKAKERLAVGRHSSPASLNELTVEKIAAAAADGDALANDLLAEAATLLARALAPQLAVLNPDTVVFAGGISNCLPLVRLVFDGELKRNTPAFSLEGVKLCASEFGESAGMVGAAKLATLENPSPSPQ